jgi:hypothetical protein
MIVHNASASAPTDPDADREFQELVRQWTSDVSLVSSVQKMVSYPGYVRIIGMGRKALPLLLREMRDRPHHWFIALVAIAGENPVPAGATFEEARQAWLAWGRSNRLIG